MIVVVADLWPEEEVAPAKHVVAITIEVHHVAE
jgi:hypothetical protein